jgi:hypothetical protein
MEETTKGAEVRARVTETHFAQLAAIAKGRGEQLPVIVREAIAEYLGRHALTPGVGPALLDALRDRPDVAELLITLGRVLQASPAPTVTYGKGQKKSKPSSCPKPGSSLRGDTERIALRTARAGAGDTSTPPK